MGVKIMNLLRAGAAALLGLCLLAGVAAKAHPAAERIEKNVVYGSYSGLALLLDVHHPARPNGLALLHIPGSGFQAPLSMEPHGIKDSPQITASLAPYLAQGFTIFVINHRAAPRFVHPAPVEDVQRAASFVHDRARGMGLAQDWLGVVGGSSGGNLALLLATRKAQPNQALSAGMPQCVVAAMAPTDLLTLGREGPAVPLATQHTGTIAPLPQEEGSPGYAEALAPYLDASPIEHLARGITTRFLLMHGDADRLVPADQSRRFADRAQALGLAAELLIMPDTGHFVPLDFADRAARWMQACAAETSVRG
jgi:acetyl esterase/lipase